MSNELTTQEEAKNALALLGGKTTLDSKTAEEITGVKATRFFPFLQLLQKTSNAVGDHKPGTFLFRTSGQDKSPRNLGDSFQALVISIRGKSTFYDKENELVRAEYFTAQTPATENYEKYRDAAKADNSVSSPYRAGLDCLLWLPEFKCFATYFANTVSTTAAIEQQVAPYCPATVTDFVPVRVYSDTRKNKKGTWYVPSAKEAEGEGWELPTDEVLLDALKLFLFPKTNREDKVPEGAEEAEKPTRVR